MAGINATAIIGDALRWFDANRHTASDFLAAWFDVSSRLDDDARREFKRYYAGYMKYFDPYMRHSYDRRLEPLLDRVKAGTRVLEVGSGCGSESLFLACLGCDVTGLELNGQRLYAAHDLGCKHEYGVERVTSVRSLARLFEEAGFRAELVRHERLFPNVGVARGP